MLILNQGDVKPDLIMKRVQSASGANYSVHKEAARKFEPIAPVGTNYKPIGQVDVGALRKGAPKDVIGKVVSECPPFRYSPPTPIRAQHTRLRERNWRIFVIHHHHLPFPLHLVLSNP